MIDRQGSVASGSGGFVAFKTGCGDRCGRAARFPGAEDGVMKFMAVV